MDVTSITNTANALYNEQSAKLANERAEQKASQKEDTGQQQGSESTTVKAANIHNTRAIRSDLINGYHGLTVQQARQTVKEAAAMIGNSTPWKLAETQPILDRSLLDGGYY